MGVYAWRSQNSLAGGIISGKLFGRIDLQQYHDSLADLFNMTVMPHGGATRRSGTFFGWQAKAGESVIRLIPFEFSADVSYVIEAGDGYFRFGKNGSQIMNGGSPVELLTDYAAADLFELQFVQSGDILWIVHQDYRPVRLLRYSDTEWYLDPVVFIDGPYQIGRAHV